MSLDINHKEQTSISILSKQQEMIQIFKKHYDFLEKLANYSSNCHNYLNHQSLASFPTLEDINTQKENIIYASTCYVYLSGRRHNGYDIEKGTYNPNHYIRTLITTTGIYQFNAEINERSFTPWDKINIYNFQFEYLAGNANNSFDKQWKRIFQEIIDIKKIQRHRNTYQD